MGVCIRCGYDLRGSVSPECPECGALTDREQRRELQKLISIAESLVRKRRLYVLGVLALLLASPCFFILYRQLAIAPHLPAGLLFLAGLVAVSWSCLVIVLCTMQIICVRASRRALSNDNGEVKSFVYRTLWSTAFTVCLGFVMLAATIVRLNSVRL